MSRSDFFPTYLLRYEIIRCFVRKLDSGLQEGQIFPICANLLFHTVQFPLIWLPSFFRGLKHKSCLCRMLSPNLDLEKVGVDVTMLGNVVQRSVALAVKELQLKGLKRIHIQFDPFHPSTRSIRYWHASLICALCERRLKAILGGISIFIIQTTFKTRIYI